MLTLANPSSFSEAITQAIRCDNRLFKRRQEKKVTSNAQLWNSQPTTLPLVPQTTPIARPASFGPTPMQIDTTKFKPLTEVEKLHRRINNLCLYCGNPGHIARQCPQKLVKLQVQAVETPQELETRTSSHSRSRATGSHPTPLLKGSCFVVGPSPSFTQYVDIIHISKNIPQVSALVDSGATSSFIDQTFVAQHNIPVVKKSTLILVEVIDGRSIAFGAITHETTPPELCIGKHTEKIVLNIISTPHHPIILGLPWLEAHNPIIDWQSRTLTFNAQQCTSQEPQAQTNTLSSLAKNLVVKNPKKVGTNFSFLKFVMSSPIVKNPPVARTKPCPVKNLVKNPAQKTNPVRIFVDGAVPFYRAAKNLQVFAIHVNPTNDKNPQSKPTPIKLPEKYKDFVDVFKKNNADQLPAHRPYDCPIDLEEGHLQPFGPIYGLSKPKLQALRDYLTENLAKGFV